MRGKDVKPGLAVAVVVYRRQGDIDDAVRAVVVRPQDEGYLCRFDEPMVLSTWSLTPAREKPLLGQGEQRCQEAVFNSLHILAPWEEYARARDARLEERQQLQERLAFEGHRLEQLNDQLQQALVERGCWDERCRLTTSNRQADGTRHQVANLSLSPDAAERLLGRRRQGQQADAQRAGALLEPLQAMLAAHGGRRGDERLHVYTQASYQRRPDGTTNYGQNAVVTVPLEVMERWCAQLRGDGEPEPDALQALLAPLL